MRLLNLHISTRLFGLPWVLHLKSTHVFQGTQCYSYYTISQICYRKFLRNQFKKVLGVDFVQTQLLANCFREQARFCRECMAWDRCNNIQDICDQATRAIENCDSCECYKVKRKLCSKKSSMIGHICLPDNEIAT